LTLHELDLEWLRNHHFCANFGATIPPYSTSFGPKMPGIAAEVGGFSGILVSEVLHFLTGHWVQLGCVFNEEIEKWGFTREIISMGYGIYE